MPPPPPKRKGLRLQMAVGSMLEEYLRDHNDAPRRVIELATLGLVASRVGVNVTIIQQVAPDPTSVRAGAASPSGTWGMVAEAVEAAAPLETSRNPLADMADDDMAGFRELVR